MPTRSLSVAPLALYARAARAYWPVVMLVTAVAALLLGAVAGLRAPVYRTDLRLVVSFGPLGEPALESSAEAAALTGAERRLIEARVRTYTRKATSEPVLRAVIAALRLPYRPGELAGKVTAATPLDTTFIDVTVVDPDPRRAARIGDAVAAELDRVAVNERSAPAPGSRLRVLVYRPPPVPSRPVRVPWERYVAAGVVGGLAAGLGLATLRLQLAERRRRRIHDGW